MIDIIKKSDCVGCYACYNRCPKNCIDMIEDNEGFVYPKVNQSLCINCGLCEKVCPVINKYDSREPVKVYALKNPNEQIRAESSSGGIFTSLAEIIINKGGVVFGAEFNDSWEVRHSYSETDQGLVPFRGSKYVQSKIGDSYLMVENFLKKGRKVLFSGTPCQIAGLRLFLKKEYENLFLVDFVCHGVPSPKVFKLYIKSVLKKCNVQNSNIKDLKFRNKEQGWKTFSFNIRLHSGKLLVNESLFKNIYLRGFLKDLYLRPSCHQCCSKSLSSGSDITIADFWGIHKYYPEFDDDKGVSLVMLMSNKGKLLYDQTTNISLEASYEQAYEGNKSISMSVKAHPKRESFFKRIDKNTDIERLIEQTLKESYLMRIKRKMYFLFLKLKIYKTIK